MIRTFRENIGPTTEIATLENASTTFAPCAGHSNVCQPILFALLAMIKLAISRCMLPGKEVTKSGESSLAWDLCPLYSASSHFLQHIDKRQEYLQSKRRFCLLEADARLPLCCALK
jgi:hypothetical protein